MRDLLRSVVRPVFSRAPGLRRIGLRMIDWAIAPILFWFTLRHHRPPADIPADRSDADTDQLNAAAQQYFAMHASDVYLRTKPFSEPAAFSRRLIDVGVLVDRLRLTPGMTVLELGAGTCWVSLMLNKFGCRTIAVDVSPTGLDLGRRAFEADRLTNWTLDPQFLSYDGRHLPIGDAAVDAIVLFDAFHHLPNPRQLLGEMHRVLARDGVVGMSEPGRGHAESQPSQSESAETGVLEDELFVEHVAQLAIDAGFRSARRVVGGHRPLLEIDLRASGAFMGGRHFATYWDGLCSALESHYLIVLYKDEAAATTSARPRRLIAHLSSSVASLHASVGITANLEVRARNVGDTTWLASSGAPGWTRLGIHLYQAAPRRVVDYDWVRVALPSDITPGDTATMTCSLPALVAPGDYLVVADLVIEGVTWFADRESAALTVPLRVR